MLKVPERLRPPAPTPYKEYIPRVYSDKRKVSQCYICMGIEGPSYLDDRRFATLLLSMIFGGGMTSRLFQEVREKRGLAYSVYCSSDFYLHSGILVIFLAVDPRKARHSVAQVSKEIKRLKRGGVTRDELKSAKQQLKGNLLLGLESTTARMSRLARQELYLGRHVPVETSLKRAMNVKRDAVVREARRIMDASRFSLVTVGPPSTDFPTESDLDF